MTFGEWLADHMEEIERGDVFIAKKIGKDRVTVSNWKTDKTKPKIDDVFKIIVLLSDELGVRINDVWSDLLFAVGDVENG